MLPDIRTTRIQGRQIGWREAGSGPPLVFVHGIGGHSGSWERQFLSFSRDYRVIAWDAPGYGESEALADEELNVCAYAASLVGLLAALDVERPHLVGHSLGAIVISAASKHDDLGSQSLTLLQPVTGNGRLPLEERERVRRARIDDMKRLGPQRFAADRGRQILSRTTSEALAAEAVAVMAQVPEAGYLAAWEMMCCADLLLTLNKACATQVICGADDPVSPPGAGEAIATQIPNAQFYCLADVGHYASIEASAALDDLIHRFIISK